MKYANPAITGTQPILSEYSKGEKMDDYLERMRKNLVRCAEIQEMAQNETGLTSSRINHLIFAIYALADLVQEQGAKIKRLSTGTPAQQKESK